MENTKSSSGAKRPRLVEMRAIALELLCPHPDAEAFGADEDDRAALKGSVAECGLLDPLSVIRGESEPDGAVNADGSPHLRERWLVIDGVGRLEALRSYGPAARIPCMVFDLGGFSPREFAMHRNTMQRKVTTGQRVLCYLATSGWVSRETPPDEAEGVSRETPTEGAKKIAAKLGCSNADVVAASELRRAMENETDGAIDEVYADVMAGKTPIRRWKAALAGMTATKGKAKKKTDYEALAARTCASLSTIFKAWPKLKGETKGRIEDALCAALATAPFELPHAATEGDGR